jgi:uncharacterized membrane protein YhfC
MASAGAAAAVMVVVLAAVIKKKARVEAGGFFVGAAVFAVCLAVASLSSGLLAGVADGGLLLALSALRAGVVEEGGRYLAFSAFLKRKNKVGDALMYGAGHGGAEALLLYAVPMAAGAAVAAMAAGMEPGGDALAPEQAEAFRAAMEALADVGLGDVALGLLERVSAMIIHMSLSVTVFISARGGGVWRLLAAMALHAAVDGLIALLEYGVVSVAGLELILLAAAVALALMAIGQARRYRRRTEAAA